VSNGDDASAIDAILRHHGLHAAWRQLVSTGIANRIYATDAVVIRVALDDAEALADAHTEWVAAPVAHAAGVLTPRLIASEDSRRLVATPYSIWERVDGEALGQFARRAAVPRSTWQAIGRELARLHTEVRACPDPHGWLDTPALGDPRQALTILASAGRLDAQTARALEAWIERLQRLVAGTPPVRFVHDDLHEMNLMCRGDGALAALIDWGDAGWGDPALDFAALPVDGMTIALEALEEIAPDILGDGVEARGLWARLTGALERMTMDPRRDGKLKELVRFAAGAPPRWRAFTASIV
jgi:aminoglycoside phosphotransferase (APT) family kinase protein